MNKVQWEIPAKLKEGEGLEEVRSVLFKNRGIGKREEGDFLHPPHPRAFTPDDLGVSKKHLERALDRVQKAIREKQKILVYGDYDADGICAAAIMWEALYTKGADVRPYIPDRFKDGYGLNPSSLKEILKENDGINLVITVDNGIVAHEAVEHLKDNGIDVIVSDHHQKGGALPKATAVLHTNKVSGATVSYIFARLINPGYDPLDLVAIGAVADQIPLVGVNRSFVKHGLSALQNTHRPGLRVLFESAKIEKMGVYEVGFLVAPRINAAGRVEHGIEALRLVCTTSRKRAQELVKLVNSANTNRQLLVERLAEKALEEAKGQADEHALVISGKYHEGVIGLVASKLVEEYAKPAIVISTDGEVGKASARSVKAVHVLDMILAQEELILGGGGHPMAAGFSINIGDIEQFTKNTQRWAKENIDKGSLQKTIFADIEIPLSVVDWDLLSLVSEFSPTGIGNPTPLFATRGVLVKNTKVVGSTRSHLKLDVADGSRSYPAIAFGMGALLENLSNNDSVDILYRLEENNWNGAREIQLVVKDIKCKK